MKLAPVVLALSLTACLADDQSPSLTSPQSPPVPSPITPIPAPVPTIGAMIQVLIIDRSGACIEGATLRVIRGQEVGRTATQNQPCSVWSYGDDGAQLGGLTAGVEMAIVLSASGYVSKEITVVPPLRRYEVELLPEGK